MVTTLAGVSNGSAGMPSIETGQMCAIMSKPTSISGFAVSSSPGLPHPQRKLSISFN